MNIMNKKLSFAMLVATGMVLSTNMAFADHAYVTTRTVEQPVAETTTTTTTAQPDSAVIMRDSVGNTEVISTPSTAVETTRTTEVSSPAVVEEKTVRVHRHHHFW
jgi:hypothetical protein